MNIPLQNNYVRKPSDNPTSDDASSYHLCSAKVFSLEKIKKKKKS